MKIEEYITPETVKRIFAWYQARRKPAHRPHLGGSQIGAECSRALFYQFRWADTPDHDGRVLRLFETGDREERRVIDNLRAIGVTVWDRDPETGKQIAFTAHGGHFALSLDGVVEGLPESGKPHTLEIKTMNERNFGTLERDGLQKAKPIYWAQCQIGMHMAGLDRCLFIAVNKNDDSIYAERVKIDHETGAKLLAKAAAIIFAERPPPRINEDPSFYICRFCDYRHVCHEGKPPEVNCRTCAHSTPEKDGSWSCAKGLQMWRECPAHLFNPYLLGWEMTDAGDDWIEYVTPDGEIIRNHEANSREIAAKWTPF
jgi:rubrerythrin